MHKKSYTRIGSLNIFQGSICGARTALYRASFSGASEAAVGQRRKVWSAAFPLGKGPAALMGVLARYLGGTSGNYRWQASVSAPPQWTFCTSLCANLINSLLRVHTCALLGANDPSSLLSCAGTLDAGRLPNPLATTCTFPDAWRHQRRRSLHQPGTLCLQGTQGIRQSDQAGIFLQAGRGLFEAVLGGGRAGPLARTHFVSIPLQVTV